MLLISGQTDALTSRLYSTLPFEGSLCGSNALQIISRAVMCDQPVMSAAAETNGGPEKKQGCYFMAGCMSVGLKRGETKRAFTPSSRAIFTLQISSCMIREMLSNKETMARLCPLSCSTSNSPFDASHLEQHIRGRSVLGDLLQTGVHKIAEIVRPENKERCYYDGRKCHAVQ